ncbi:hypothetical protein M409DRAFT_18863 [Zasmidium cellare ATCC 36951]|uniref:NTF2-like domain-containing protein n=1 Tax=Zasmidium cellare ATCC 36951 TaxID=1080233 RepID=A0A6A6CUV5_ZASCE|nr:uncharacterized protein M409DRAFT_18863 [Zasmidium cellare ATCC 36951]KAF2170891.1 hypothetical protein M409DRAFT_18863 [Zasmidium cellare ATCC 36951]
MKITILTTALAMLCTASAAATNNNPPPSYGGGKCVSQQEGQNFLQKFIGVLGRTDPNYAATAQKIIADDFVEYSNSILSLQGLPLSAPLGIAAPFKDAWIQGVTQAPAFSGIKTLEVIVTCDRIVWYWVFTGIGSAKHPAAGFNLFHLKRKGPQLQVEKLFLEFDSIAWGLDTGIQVTYPNGTVLPPK